MGTILALMFMAIQIARTANPENVYFPNKCTELSFVPMPHQIKCDLSKKFKVEFKSPCTVKFNIVVPSVK